MLSDTVEVSRTGLAGVYWELMTMINEGKAREQVLQARVAELERKLRKRERTLNAKARKSAGTIQGEGER